MEREKLDSSALLSSRELEILEFVVAGLSNYKISQELDISKRTVDNHISNILKKPNAPILPDYQHWSF